MRRATDANDANRRGCYILVAFLALALLSLAAIGFGWLGKPEANRVTDPPVIGSAQ